MIIRRIAVAVGAAAAALVSPTSCAHPTGDPTKVSASQATVQGGWSHEYNTTTCRQFDEDMTGAQRLIAAESILGGDWYADPPAATGDGEGYPNPPDWLVAQFDTVLQKACAQQFGSNLGPTADGVIASSGHWRLEQNP